ncbi:hypothetical protein GCM10018780_83200 [Streptomyces lanatus]|nr:hypothetical protein GCM10018780_83200 [Streptomyces lanatus]
MSTEPPAEADALPPDRVERDGGRAFLTVGRPPRPRCRTRPPKSGSAMDGSAGVGSSHQALRAVFAERLREGDSHAALTAADTAHDQALAAGLSELCGPCAVRARRVRRAAGRPRPDRRR